MAMLRILFIESLQKVEAQNTIYTGTFQYIFAKVGDNLLRGARSVSCKFDYETDVMYCGKASFHTCFHQCLKVSRIANSV